MDNTPSPAFHPLDYASVLRRRLWWLVIPVVLAVAVGAALVAFLPRTYETSTVIGVAIPSMSQELVTSAQRVNPEERLRNIQQILFSPSVLERVVREEGFDRTMPVSEAIIRVQGNITTNFRQDPNLPAGSIGEFTVSYSDTTPALAQRVANRIADVFVQESSVKRAVRAEETSMFIGSQVEASQRRLSELESRLRDAKEASMGALPEQTSANVQMVTGMQQQLDTTSNAIRGEQDRLSTIERNIDAARAGASNPAAAPGAPPMASSAAARVAQIEQRIGGLRGTITDKHPDMQMLNEELAAARAAAAAEATKPMEDRVATLRFDPSYAALLRDQEQARFRIRDLQREEELIRAQIATYRSRVELAPRVEQQMATLNREYQLEKDQVQQPLGQAAQRGGDGKPRAQSRRRRVHRACARRLSVGAELPQHAAPADLLGAGRPLPRRRPGARARVSRPVDP